MTRMLNVAILGSGKIGIDLLCKIRKSKVLSCELVAGRNLKSEGLIFARKKGFNVSNKGIDAIIGAHSQSALENPQKINGALITQAGKEGYYVGVIEMEIKKGKVISNSGKIDTMKLNMPDDPIIMKMIEEYENRSGRINHRKLDMKENH